MCVCVGGMHPFLPAATTWESGEALALRSQRQLILVHQVQAGTACLYLQSFASLGSPRGLQRSCGTAGVRPKYLFYVEALCGAAQSRFIFFNRKDRVANICLQEKCSTGRCLLRKKRNDISAEACVQMSMVEKSFLVHRVEPLQKPAFQPGC